MVARDMKDPRLGFITVTRVELTADLRYARVYVSALGEGKDGGASLDVLKKASGFVRREIGRRLRVRLTPEIDFRHDPGLEATDRVARLLADEHATRPPASPPEEADANEDEDAEPRE